MLGTPPSRESGRNASATTHTTSYSLASGEAAPRHRYFRYPVSQRQSALKRLYKADRENRHVTGYCPRRVRTRTSQRPCDGTSIARADEMASGATCRISRNRNAHPITHGGNRGTVAAPGTMSRGFERASLHPQGHGAIATRKSNRDLECNG